MPVLVLLLAQVPVLVLVLVLVLADIICHIFYESSILKSLPVLPLTNLLQTAEEKYTADWLAAKAERHP